MDNNNTPNLQPQQNNGAQFALIMGIIALVCPVLTAGSCWILALGFTPVIGIAAGIMGIIFSVKAKKTGASTTAALVLSIIGLVLCTILFFSCTLCTTCVACAANDINNSINNSLNDLDINDILNNL